MTTFETFVDEGGYACANESKGESILQYLDESYVFKLVRHGSIFVAIDGCDNYWVVPLTRDDISELIKELQGLLDEH